MNKLTLSTLALLLTLGLTACSQDDNEGVDLEKAGDNVEEMTDDAGDTVEEAAEDTGDAVEEGYDDMTE
jgi:hypothetical protein